MFQDFNYAIRKMGRSKSWTVVVLLSLALGIGGNTALFSLVDAALLTKLPVTDPDDLVLFEWASGPRWPAAGIAGPVDRDPATNAISGSAAFSYDTFEAFSEESQSLSAVFAFARLNLTAMIDGESETVTGQLVSGN